MALSLVSLNGRALALELPQSASGAEAVSAETVFTIHTQGDRLEAISTSGFKVQFDIREARQALPSREKTSPGTLDVNDIALVETITGARVSELLADIESTIPVIVQVNVGAFDNSAFENYGSRLATAAIRLRKNNVRIMPTGSPELIERLYDFDTRARAVFVSRSQLPQALKDGARLAYLTLPGEWDPDATNIPFAQLEAGDVPAFEPAAELAAAGARLGKSPIPSNFRSAWELLAGLGSETLAPGDIRNVMDGHASQQLGARLALKPLLHALLNVILHAFDTARRQVRESA